MINVVGDHAIYHLKYDAPLTSDSVVCWSSSARPHRHIAEVMARETGSAALIFVVHDSDLIAQQAFQVGALAFKT